MGFKDMHLTKTPGDSDAIDLKDPTSDCELNTVSSSQSQQMVVPR